MQRNTSGYNRNKSDQPMKRIKIYSAIAAMALIGCDEDYTPPTATPSHRVIYTTEMDFENKVQVNGQITFGDVSPGIASRLWTFPVDGIDIVGADNDQTTTAPTVKAIFGKPGIHEVKLSQTFLSDAYVDNELKGRQLDTTIVVNVLDSVMATYTANYLDDMGTVGEALTVGNNTQNKVSTNTQVRYQATAAGEPEDYIWVLEGVADEDIVLNDELGTATVTYRKAGRYATQLIASRDRPAGADTLLIQGLVEVVE